MDKVSEQISADLAKVVRGDVFADVLNKAAYSTDASIYQIIPSCIVAPRDSQDVVTVVKYAHSKGIPINTRGAGSGVAGESLCSGIVLDMRRYMSGIIGENNNGAFVTCQPGVVLDDLNNYIAPFGRKIGPDPSTSNRATVGGCVANNATGAHSLTFGYIGDYVEKIEAVLADGSVVELVNDFVPTEQPDEPVASIAGKCLSVIAKNQAVIKKALPETKRNRSGYNIAGICHNGRIDMAKLLAGSEGTLAVFTKITLRAVAVPASKALLQLEFDSLDKMAQAVPLIVEAGASACELMDKLLIGMAFEALPEYRDVLPTDAQAVLLVEHTGEQQEQVREKIKKTESAVSKLVSGRTIVFDAVRQERLWKCRKDAVPLLYRKKGKKHPVPFVEDVSVVSDKLGEYISGLQEIGRRFDVGMSFYGHAGDGELHIRPYLDLSEPDGVRKMLDIANDVFSLAWSLGGSISGEHADGLVRAAFIKRQYGEEFYEILCRVKDIFDADGVLNPGKIINPDSNIMVKNLKAGHKLLPERLRTDLIFVKNELAFEIDQCSGCGLCLSEQSDLFMCPVYRALNEELAGPRAKANVLRYWATGQLDEENFESPEFGQFLDMCINCKLCYVECPAGVDVSKLMSTVRAKYVKRRGLKQTKRLLSHNRYLSMLGSFFSPVSNFVMRLGIFKWFLEKATGLDKRRTMPKFRWGSFLKNARKFLGNHPSIESPIDKVAYFVDTYANYNDHELGFAVLKVLLANGIEVIVPKQRPAPLPAICYGDVKTARKDLSFNVRRLAKAVRDGYKIVCSEPSAALCLRDELRHFVAGEDARLVSENTYELMSYLLELHRKGKLRQADMSAKDKLLRRYAPRNDNSSAGSARNDKNVSFVYHLPCHLHAIGGGASVELLEKVCGLKAVELNAGCCGLAGTFGMQKKNYELSSNISEGLKEALAKSPARNVLTECAACAMQIEHISEAKVTHPIKILADCYSV